MKKVTQFEAADGMRFDSETDCLAYEDKNLNAKIMQRLGITRQLNALMPVGWAVGVIARAVEMGVIHLDSPRRTAYCHLRKWLDIDQADLVESYQDWLQNTGARLGRTPNAVHTRLREAYKEMADNGEHIKV